jgi:hypothetical protein
VINMLKQYRDTAVWVIGQAKLALDSTHWLFISLHSESIIVTWEVYMWDSLDTQLCHYPDDGDRDGPLSVGGL